MWLTNKYKKEFQEVIGADIQKSVKSEQYYIVNKKSSLKELLIPLPFRSFLFQEYSIVPMVIIGLSLVEVFVYQSLLFIFSALFVELGIYLLKNKLKWRCMQHIKSYFTILRLFFITEFSFLLFVFISGNLFLNFNQFVSYSRGLSELVLLNFYLFFRLYLLSLRIKFQQIFKIERYPSFFVWRESC